MEKYQIWDMRTAQIETAGLEEMLTLIDTVEKTATTSIVKLTGKK